MAYRIIDLELTEPLPSSSLDSASAAAFILRRKGRVLGFLMNPISPGTHFDEEKLSQWIFEEIGTRWVQECVREELASSGASPSRPRLTVAVCTKDRPASLQRCLKALSQLDDPIDTVDAQWEVLVVDNAPSDDGTKRVVEQFPDVRYVCEARPGLNFARNRALHEASGELLAYLDDDVVVDRFWLHGLAEAYAENPDAAAITGQVLPLELETDAQLIFERRGGFRHGFEKVRYTSGIPDGDDGFLYPCRTGIFGVGCNMAFRRRILLEIDGFDEALDTGKPLAGGGDHDIFYRIIRAGHTLVYEPGFLVFHQHRRTMEQLRKQYWSWGLSVMAFARKAHRTDPGLRSRWRRLMIAWFVFRLRELVASMFGRGRLPARFAFCEMLGGCLGFCGEYNRSVRRTTKIRRLNP